MPPEKPGTEIPKEQLEDGRVYLLRSRHLSCGIWDSSAEHFTGIREKFGSVFLDSETFYGPQTGTAKPIQAMGYTLPKEIKAIDATKTRCSVCQQHAELHEDAEGRQNWQHQDQTPLCVGGRAQNVQKQAIFSWLIPIDAQAKAARQNI